jgi:hypothetical protein
VASVICYAADQFGAAMQAAGIGDGTTVVANAETDHSAAALGAPGTRLQARHRWASGSIIPSMVQTGLLLIADITGYSTYINRSELEHARGSLTDLLNLLITQTRLPLVISKLEGDAVFSYAPARSILQGQKRWS